MRHARDQDLDRLDDLLAELRTLPGLIERKRGVFYRKSRAFLHFHEDSEGMFADLTDPDERIDVTGPAGRTALLAAARSRLEA
jgi:N-acetylglutamate synthase-like GNAT family acetyltransferase